jgi:Na+-transporting methylmalonyl-CoA/oxaloacetate decarboxylase gamma subunit
MMTMLLLMLLVGVIWCVALARSPRPEHVPVPVVVSRLARHRRHQRL